VYKLLLLIKNLYFIICIFYPTIVTVCVPKPKQGEAQWSFDSFLREPRLIASYLVGGNALKNDSPLMLMLE